jgi:hypothetical protein
MDEIIQAPRFRYVVECVKPDGSLRWSETIDNLVATEGLTDLLQNYFKGVAYSAAWYCGLISSTGYTEIVVGDTAASHAGWAESTKYDEATRPSITFAAAAAAAIASSSASSYTINDSDTLKGAFAITDATKGGAAGVLYSVALFTTGDRAVLAGDVVNVSVSITAASA